MDTQKFTGKQMLIILGLNVAAGLIVGLVIYQFTKPKATDPSTTPPLVAKQGTTPTVTTVTTPPAVVEG
jgi:hypothetical protein